MIRFFSFSFRDTSKPIYGDTAVGEYKEMLKKVTEYDRFELISHLNKFSIVFSELEDTEKLRNVLKKVILEELVKSNPSNECYQSLLTVTKNQLKFRAHERG